MANCCMVYFCEGAVVKACEHGWLCAQHECGDEFEGHEE